MNRLTRRVRIRPIVSVLMLISAICGLRAPHVAAADETAQQRRLLYVAVPGIRNYLEYGGHGLLVFDIDRGHRFVKRIPSAGLNAEGKPLNVKGVCASAATKRLYITTTQTLSCVDLVSEKLLWERPYDGGCDRMAIGSSRPIPSEFWRFSAV